MFEENFGFGEEIVSEEEIMQLAEEVTNFHFNREPSSSFTEDDFNHTSGSSSSSISSSSFFDFPMQSDSSEGDVVMQSPSEDGDALMHSPASSVLSVVEMNDPSSELSVDEMNDEKAFELESPLDSSQLLLDAVSGRIRLNEHIVGIFSTLNPSLQRKLLNDMEVNKNRMLNQIAVETANQQQQNQTIRDEAQNINDSLRILEDIVNTDVRDYSREILGDIYGLPSEGEIDPVTRLHINDVSKQIILAPLSDTFQRNMNFNDVVRHHKDIIHNNGGILPHANQLLHLVNLSGGIYRSLKTYQMYFTLLLKDCEGGTDNLFNNGIRTKYLFCSFKDTIRDVEDFKKYNQERIPNIINHYQDYMTSVEENKNKIAETAGFHDIGDGKLRGFEVNPNTNSLKPILVYGDEDFNFPEVKDGEAYPIYKENPNGHGHHYLRDFNAHDASKMLVNRGITQQSTELEQMLLEFADPALYPLLNTLHEIQPDTNNPQTQFEHIIGLMDNTDEMKVVPREELLNLLQHNEGVFDYAMSVWGDKFHIIDPQNLNEEYDLIRFIKTTEPDLLKEFIGSMVQHIDELHAFISDRPRQDVIADNLGYVPTPPAYHKINKFLHSIDELAFNQINHSQLTLNEDEIDVFENHLNSKTSQFMSAHPKRHQHGMLENANNNAEPLMTFNEIGGEWYENSMELVLACLKNMDAVHSLTDDPNIPPLAEVIKKWKQKFSDDERRNNSNRPSRRAIYTGSCLARKRIPRSNVIADDSARLRMRPYVLLRTSPTYEMTSVRKDVQGIEGAFYLLYPKQELSADNYRTLLTKNDSQDVLHHIHPRIAAEQLQKMKADAKSDSILQHPTLPQETNNTFISVLNTIISGFNFRPDQWCKSVEKYIDMLIGTTKYDEYFAGVFQKIAPVHLVQTCNQFAAEAQAYVDLMIRNQTNRQSTYDQSWGFLAQNDNKEDPFSVQKFMAYVHHLLNERQQTEINKLAEEFKYQQDNAQRLLSTINASKHIRTRDNMLQRRDLLAEFGEHFVSDIIRELGTAEVDIPSIAHRFTTLSRISNHLRLTQQEEDNLNRRTHLIRNWVEASQRLEENRADLQPVARASEEAKLMSFDPQKVIVEQVMTDIRIALYEYVIRRQHSARLTGNYAEHKRQYYQDYLDDIVKSANRFQNLALPRVDDLSFSQDVLAKRLIEVQRANIQDNGEFQVFVAQKFNIPQ